MFQEVSVKSPVERRVSGRDVDYAVVNSEIVLSIQKHLTDFDAQYKLIQAVALSTNSSPSKVLVMLRRFKDIFWVVDKRLQNHQISLRYRVLISYEDFIHDSAIQERYL